MMGLKKELERDFALIRVHSDLKRNQKIDAPPRLKTSIMLTVAFLMAIKNP